MAGVIAVDYKIGGTDAVIRSIKSITQATQQAARERVATGQREAREKTKAVNDAAKQERKAAADTAREVARTQRQASQAQASEAKRAARAEVAEKKKAAKEVADFQREADRAAGRNFRERVRGDTAFQREMDRAGRSNFKDRLRTSDKNQKEARSASESTTRAWAGGIGDGTSRGFNRGVGIVKAGAGLAMGAVGGVGLAEAVQGAVKLQGTLSQLAADVHDPGKEFDATHGNAAWLQGRAQSVAKKEGIGAEDVADAMSEAAGSGGGMAGLKAFEQNLEAIGELTTATGATMVDWAKVSATLTNNGIEGAEEQMSIMRSITAAGKAGNINPRDMAAGVGAVMGSHQAGSFEGDGVKRALQSSAMIQISRSGGAKNAEDAVTASRNFYSDLGSHEKKIKAMGVKTTFKDEKGNAVRVDAITQFKQLLDKTKGDITKIDPQFGNQSAPLMGALLAAYQGKNAGLTNDSGAVLSGGAAVDALMEKFEGLTMSQKDVGQEADKRKEATDKKFAIVMENFKAQVGNELLPVLTESAPAFAKLLGVVGKTAQVFAESPLKFGAGLIAASTALGALQGAAGTATTRLGGFLLDKVASFFSNRAAAQVNIQAGNVNVAGGSGVGTGGGVSGVGGKLKTLGATGVGAAGAGAIAGAVAIGALIGGGTGIAMGSAISKDLDKNESKGLDAGNLATKLRMGTATEEERKRAQALTKEMVEDKNAGFGGLFMKNATAGARGLADGNAGLNMETAGNVASLIPMLAVLRGITGGVLEGQQQDLDKKGYGAKSDGKDVGGVEQSGLAELQKALANPAPVQLAAGAELRVSNIGELAAAINTAQGPKADPPK